MIKFVFYREKQFANRFRIYEIMINGYVGWEIKNGERVVIELAPGPYKIKLMVDGCSSKEIKVNTRYGDTIEFKCGSRLKGIKVFNSLSAMDSVDEFVYLDLITN